ncbi:MAG: hypothetical protein JO041_05540, partial [Acidobacteria bacterium]|nr:hypothetical protein [Acidobacteriota bacterium]
MSLSGGEQERMEYGSYVKDGEKVYPAKMERFDRGTLTVEVNRLTVDHNPVDASMLAPAAGSDDIGQCRKFEPAWALVDRDNFKRTSKGRGVVVVGAVVDKDGAMRDVQVQQSVDPETDQLAL